MTLVFKKPVLYLIFFLSLSLFIRFLYTGVSYLLPYEPVIDVAIANTLLAIFALKNLTLGNSEKTVKSIIPSLFIILASFGISFVSKQFGAEHTEFVLDVSTILITCLWVPIVEELVYRKLFASFLADKQHILWSCYLSGLFFSMNHSLLNVSDFPINMISIPVGPFLLGAICQYLVLYSGSIFAGICFHIACNLTVYIFLYNDNRWLEWLSYLYLSGS